MNRSGLMIGVLALALGFAVIVAADDLQVGTRIEKRDIKIIRIPIADLPSGARAGARMRWDMA